MRRWVLLRTVISGLGIGLLIGAGCVAAGWALRSAVPRPLLAAGFGLLGATLGVLLARRRAFSDEEVALYLDARLDSDEIIVTALPLAEAAEAGAETDAAWVIVSRATTLLQGAPARSVRPRLFTQSHLLLPAGLALVTALSMLAPRPLPAEPPAPAGSERVSEVSTPELDEVIEALAKAKAQDKAQEERLAELRAKANALREKLQAGAPRREILAELGDLADGISREQLALGEGAEREGFEAALERLKQAELEGARRALGEHDATRLDDELAKKANAAAQKSRVEARQALEAAAKAAREGGAEAVAKALDEQLKRFDEQAARADKLRELGSALSKNLSEEAKRDLEEMNASGDAEAQKRFAEAVDKALADLSPEDLEKLKQDLQQKLKDQASKAGSADAGQGKLTPEQQKELEELIKQLESEAGRKALAEAMQQAANGQPPSADAARQQELGAAADSLSGMKQRISGEAPAPGAGTGQAGRGPGAASPKPPGLTPAIDKPTVVSKASANLRPGVPLPGSTVGRTSSRPGETANRSGTGELGRVGPDEIGGVSQSDVPEEYREQVGRYFQP